MDKELAYTLITRARDRIESARRWAYLVALILLGFHITIFSPFTSDIQRLTRVEASTSRLMGFSTEMERLRKDLDKLAAHTKLLINRAFDRLLKNKMADFEALNRAVIAVLRSENKPLPGESIQAPGERDLTLQSPLQSTIASSVIIPQAAKLTPELLEQIRQHGNNIEELRLVLLPHIRANIIEPRFEELNRKLKKSVLPGISEKAKTTIKSLEQLQKNQSRWTEPLSALIRTLQIIVKTASSLEVKPPADDSWWESVQAKVVTLETLAEGAVHNLNQDARALGNQMHSDLLDALEKQNLIVADLKASILELRTHWNEIQARILEREMHMKSLGDKVGWITIDLEMAVAFFPLILSVILTGLLVWITRPMRELILILAMAPEPKKELWTWYYRCIGDPLSGPTNASGKRGKTMWRSLLDAGLWVPVIWVAIASWQVSSWQQVGAIRASVMTLIGWALILGAHLYRRRVMRQDETQPSC